jgi:hypothetical protein
MEAVSPAGLKRRLRVLGFAVFGGKPSDDRLARTGRLDVHVEEIGEGVPVGLRWEARPLKGSAEGRGGGGPSTQLTRLSDPAAPD